MDEQFSVLILARNQDIKSNLCSDLEALGYKPLLGMYADIDTNGILLSHPDIVVLDLTIWDRYSRETCELLLRKVILPTETPLVALVSENTMGLIPLNYNFADTLRSPYDITELGFRLRRLVYIYMEHFKDTINIGNLSLSPSRYEVKVDGQSVALRQREFELLKYLVTHPNRVFSREELITGIRGVVDNRRTIDVHICRIRTKIGDINCSRIRSVRGVGYAFRSEN